MNLESRCIEEVQKHREEIQGIVSGRNSRLLMVAGPCSIHDVDEAREYAHKLSRLQNEVVDDVKLVMRVYSEKPRTTLGWKGLRIDPHKDGSYDVETGISLTRDLMKDVTLEGLGIAEESLYVDLAKTSEDLVSYHALGARTSESQIHREYFSGLGGIAGIKHPTSGCISTGVNSVYAVSRPQKIVSSQGVVETPGNAYGHLVLRGGPNGSNLDIETFKKADASLRAKGLVPRIMADVSHSNSLVNGKKEYLQQIQNVHDLLEMRHEGVLPRENLLGFMVESNLRQGNQPLADSLEYGVSVTDPCIDFDQTQDIVRLAAFANRKYGVVQPTGYRIEEKIGA